MSALINNLLNLPYSEIAIQSNNDSLADDTRYLFLVEKRLRDLENNTFEQYTGADADQETSTSVDNTDATTLALSESLQEAFEFATIIDSVCKRFAEGKVVRDEETSLVCIVAGDAVKAVDDEGNEFPLQITPKFETLKQLTEFVEKNQKQYFELNVEDFQSFWEDETL